MLACRGVLRISAVHFFRFFFLSIFFFCTGNLFPLDPLYAEETICAQVKIEIKQEMTFERQAFDAYMQISNGLTTLSLGNINIDVLFSDEMGETVRASVNPDDPDALFYIRIDSMDGIDDITGNGTIAPAATADIHWLIIPAPASVAEAPSGALYFVGARLSYTLGGEEYVTEVTPDIITVRPLPLLSLDYFLPDEVYGDDPFTVEEESSIPFSLGIRISNNGHGTASDVKIDSAQPKIIDNKQGLAVDFLIEGSEVNGITAADTLLMQFGDIAPDSSAIGRWLMSCSLSGRFTEFTAEYSHSNELGGELTSLIEDVETHFLVQDVLVDAPGRDTIRDFLGRDMDLYRVYESDSGVTDVSDLSLETQVERISEIGGVAKYSINAPPTAGFFYLQFSDQEIGEKVVSEIVRSDGKILQAENGWLSKKRVDADWSFYTNIFDFNSSGSYILTLIDPGLAPQPPAFEEQEDPVQKEGEEVSFIISLVDDSEPEVASFRMLSASAMEVQPAAASDITECDGETEITSGRLPVGAKLIDRCDGTALLVWTPQEGQAGDYPLSFTATEGEFTTTVRYHLTITDAANTPTAQFSADSTSGEVPFTVLFIDESLSEDGISSWLWDFGDGNTSTEQIPTHTYDTAGTYRVSLTVVEIDGDEHSVSLKDYITAENDTIPAEFGHVAASTDWQTVGLTGNFKDPVVVATYAAAKLSGSHHARIRAVSQTEFQVRVESHQPITEQILGKISYIVMESGIHTLPNGDVVYASHFQSPIDGSVMSPALPVGFSRTPVITGTVTSDNEAGALAAALSNITLEGFQLRLHAEEGAGSAHGAERVDCIAWEPGSGFIEGTVFEVGYLEQVREPWQHYPFAEQFAAAPSFAATRQDQTETASGRVSFSSLDPLGVEAKVLQPSVEAPGGEPEPASVGFIALSSLSDTDDGDGDGIIDLDERLTYGTHPGLADTDLDGIGDYDELVYWGESWNENADGDTHINLLDMDSDNDGFRDGLEVLHGFDPVDAEHFPTGPIMEIGRVVVADEWQTISLTSKYLDPLVVAAVTESSGQVSEVMIRNIRSESFEVRTTTEADEEISYIAMERGGYQLADGTRIVANFTEATPADDPYTLSFSDEFTVSPVVMASVDSANGPGPASLALRNVSKEHFVYTLQIDSSIETATVNERIGFIAWEPSSGVTGEFTFETGHLSQIKMWWQEYQFNSPLYGIQALVATSQESEEGEWNYLFLRDLTSAGFAARFSRYSPDGFPYFGAANSIGYIALSYIPDDLDSDDDGFTDRDELQIHGTDPTLADSDGDGLDDGAEALLWGDSWDDDTDADGLVNILDIDSDNDGYNDGLEFTHGFDPADSPDFPDGPIMLAGALQVDSEWQSVSLDRVYLDPVVVANFTGDTFSQATVRIRNVESTGFEIRRVDEGGGDLDAATVSYIAMERGTYTLPDGEKVIAEHSSRRAWSIYAQHTFSDPFTLSPVVIASLVDADASDFTSVYLSSISPSMFYTGSYDSSGYTYLNSSSRIDYIAWEPSAGQTDSLFFSVSQVPDVNHKWKTYQFDRGFPTPPALIAMSQDIDGAPPAVTLLLSISETDVEMRVEPYFTGIKSSKSAKKMVGVIAIDRNDE